MRGARTNGLIERSGKPGMIVRDTGTEFTSNAMLGGTQGSENVWHFIASGKSMQSGFCESFNGRMRDALPNDSLFLGLDHARDDRSLGRRLQRAVFALSVGCLTPMAYAANLPTTVDRLRNPDQLRRSDVAPPAPHGVKPAEVLFAAG